MKLDSYQLKVAMNHSNIRKRIEIEWVYFPMHIRYCAFSFGQNVTTTKKLFKRVPKSFHNIAKCIACKYYIFLFDVHIHSIS